MQCPRKFNRIITVFYLALVFRLEKESNVQCWEHEKNRIFKETSERYDLGLNYNGMTILLVLTYILDNHQYKR